MAAPSLLSVPDRAMPKSEPLKTRIYDHLRDELNRVLDQKLLGEGANQTSSVNHALALLLGSLTGAPPDLDTIPHSEAERENVRAVLEMMRHPSEGLQGETERHLVGGPHSRDGFILKIYKLREKYRESEK